MSREKRNIVYSTDSGWTPQADESDHVEKTSGASKFVYVSKEKKGRAGKTVTLISGLQGDLQLWKKKFQSLCAAGGTVKQNMVEIQGDHQTRLVQYLQQQGVICKKKGG